MARWLSEVGASSFHARRGGLETLPCTRVCCRKLVRGHKALRYATYVRYTTDEHMLYATKKASRLLYREVLKVSFLPSFGSKITSSGTPQQQQPRKRSYRPWGCYLRSRNPRKPRKGFLKLGNPIEVINTQNNPKAFYIAIFSPSVGLYRQTMDKNHLSS